LTAVQRAGHDTCAVGIKEGAVRIVRESGKPIAQVARELGINEGTWATGVCHERGRPLEIGERG
jgi:hypothetical protein